MSGIIAGLALLGIALVTGHWYVKSDSERVTEFLRRGAGVGALLLAFFFVLRGVMLIGLPLGVYGLYLLRIKQLPGLSRAFDIGNLFGGSAAQTSPQPEPAGSEAERSEVRTAHLFMELDHATGKMNGLVLKGRYKGSALGDLSLTHLLELHQIFRQTDQHSAQLLEAWLDQAHSDWRTIAASSDQQRQTYHQAYQTGYSSSSSSGRRSAYDGQRARSSYRQTGYEKTGYQQNTGGMHSGDMSRSEAINILGLDLHGAPDRSEVNKAYHRLMKQYHPDHGGSDYLAAKINQARDVLLSSASARPH